MTAKTDLHFAVNSNLATEFSVHPNTLTESARVCARAQVLLADEIFKRSQRPLRSKNRISASLANQPCIKIERLSPDSPVATCAFPRT